MTSIGEEAAEYEPATTANIADLNKVSTVAQIETKVFKEGTEDEFKIKVINVDGKDYRVPFVVLANLKSILEEKQDLKFFKVKKDGTGMQTRYTVIPLA